MGDFSRAVIIGILYFVSNCCFGYTLTIFRRPLFLALPIGLLFGDVPTAMVIGASIQTIYIVLVAPGNQLPSDPAIAACIAIPLALSTGMSPQMAVTTAVPFGLFGAFLDQMRRSANSVFNRMADNYAEECNTRGIILTASLYPLLLTFVVQFTPVFLANYFGTSAIQGFLNVVPDWVMHGFEIAGGVLPAIGSAIAVTVIGKKALLPFFIAGFFLVAYSSISIMGAAIFGVIIAIVYIQCISQKNTSVKEA